MTDYRIVEVNGEELNEYFSFRWQQLFSPAGLPVGAERDEYDVVAYHICVKDRNNQMIGCGRMHLNQENEAQIRHIAVAAEFRKTGIGKALVTELELLAVQQGARRALVNSKRSSMTFFRNLGYEETDENEELNKQQRKQLIKHLHRKDRAFQNPLWCAELERTWHEEIPISAQMGVRLSRNETNVIEVTAGLNPNLNLHGSMFAGSLYSLATLAGWGALFLRLKMLELDAAIVLAEADIRYLKPVTTQPRALCNPTSFDLDKPRLQNRQRQKIDISVSIYDQELESAIFNGSYCLLPK